MDLVTYTLAKKYTDTRLSGAIRNQKEDYARLKVPSSNIIEGVTIYNNKYIASSTGELKEGASGTGINTVTDYIEVYGKTISHSHRASIACYDNNRNFIGGLPGAEEGINRTLIVGTKYVRVSFIDTDYEDIVVAVDVNMYSPFNEDKIKSIELENDMSKSLVNFKEYEVIGGNLFNPNDVIIGHYPNVRTGLWQDKPSLIAGFDACSGIIPVKPNTEYRKPASSCNIIYYDKNGAYISGLGWESTSFITPENCYYIRAALKKEDISSFYILEGRDPNQYEPYSFTLRNLKVENPSEISFKSVLRDIQKGISIDTETPEYTEILVEDDYETIVLSPPAGDTARLVRFMDVSPNTIVTLNLNAKTNNPAKDKASMQIRYFRNGIEVLPSRLPRYDLTSTEYKDYKFQYVVPREANCIRLVIYCRDETEMKIRSLSIKVNEQVNPIDSGIRFIGHRALSGLAPENTMAGFELARRAGMWGTVINTQMTRDGHLVSLHDVTIDRTSNGTGDIGDMTLAEARTYDYGSYFNEYYKNEQLPLIDDVLRFCAISGIHPVLRLSDRFLDDSDGAFTKLYDLIKKYGLLNKCTVKGFASEGLSSFYAIAGNTLRYGWCVGSITQDNIDFMKQFQNENYEGAFLDVHYSGISEESVALARDNNMPVTGWLIDDFDIMNNVINLGVTEITTGTLTLQNCQF